MLLLGSVEQQRSSVGRRENATQVSTYRCERPRARLVGSCRAACGSRRHDFFYLTQPNGKKIIFAPISIVAIWRPPQGVCKGETQIVTGPMSFCVSDQPEDVIKKLQTFPCVENPRTSAQTLRRCK